MKKAVEFFTTGQIAAYCGVNFRTVIRWIKKGMLPAQRLPGRGDHRVTKAHLLEFLAKNSWPIPLELQGDDQGGLEREEPGDNLEDGQQRRILVVEDDVITANAIKRVLLLQGYEVRAAHDGFEAGRLIEGFRPHLMTLDILMQGLDGLAVLRSLQGDKKLSSLKVIVISGDSDAKIRSALELGASRSLKKPFSNKELVAAVHDLIGESGGKSTSHA